MLYRDLLSGKFYRLPGGTLVRAYRHPQCVELREQTPEGELLGGRWLAHPEGRVRVTRGEGQGCRLDELQPVDRETEAHLRQQFENCRQQLEAVIAASVDDLPERPWRRADLLDVLRRLQSLHEEAIQLNHPVRAARLETAQEAGYDLWMLLVPPQLH
ncbi:hypothetical protein ABS71_16305 [bacterium SCN 62-11]|nr:hypothetical protein [Candidatus Eremiobacteraeota bacterium]ODT62032.1 MAG: hypothetical protein ABS71_16305 [bacterium SCN 62-11]